MTTWYFALGQSQVQVWCHDSECKVLVSCKPEDMSLNPHNPYKCQVNNRDSCNSRMQTIEKGNPQNKLAGHMIGNGKLHF